MAATKEFQGKLLISGTDGKKLGEIKDVYLDKDATKLVGVYLGKSGIINRKVLTIEIDHVVLFGIDCWLINGSDKVIIKEFGTDDSLLAEAFRGREIQTDGGTKLGTVGDILIDGTSKVTGFSFDKLLVEGPLSETKAIAREAIINLGGRDVPMIAALDKAEKLKVSK